MRSKNGGDGGTGVYMREGTTQRATATDRPYGEFYGFYSVSPENFGSTHVCMHECMYACVYVSMYVCMCESMYVFMYVCMHVFFIFY